MSPSRTVLSNTRVPILGFAAPSGTGKTTLLVKLLPALGAHGLRVGVIKHAHHDFDIDQPGKDSYELRKAGTAQMLVASARRWALMVERKEQAEPGLDELLVHLDQDRLDLILVEGFKHAAFPKIELYRPVTGNPPRYPDDPSVIAIATDAALPVPTHLPVLDLNDPAWIADFIRQNVLGRPRAATPDACNDGND